MRVGVIGRKLGMTSLISEAGDYTPATVIDINDCQIVNVKSLDKDGYNALQVGFGDVKAKKLNKAQKGYFAKQKVSLKGKLVEFRVSAENLMKIGDVIPMLHYEVGQFVDVSSHSIGKGTAGVMKRHNFSGLRASHGVSVSHRSQGSTGQCQDPGKVFKGKKMAGRLGNARVTVQNLQVLKIDLEDNLLIIKGAVPGAKGSVVEIKDAVKKH